MPNRFATAVALSFVLTATGVTATEISEKIVGPVAQTAQVFDGAAVSLETLKSRDRDILVQLAETLAERHGHLLVGSEVVFSRMSEAGTIVYVSLIHI